MNFTRISTKALIYDRSSGNFLLVKSFLHRFSHRYGLPGGGVKYREDTKDALIRELREETGVNFEVLEHKIIYYGVHSTVKKFLFFTITRDIHIFSLIIDQSPIIKPNWEVASFMWVSKADLKNYISHFYGDLFIPQMLQEITESK
jgi:phosphoglycolate phosphatase